MRNSLFLMAGILIFTQLNAQRVGVGTSTPGARLDIMDSSRTQTRVFISSKHFSDSTSLSFRNMLNSVTGTEMIISARQEAGLYLSSSSDLPENTTPNILHVTPQGRIVINGEFPHNSSVLDIRSTDKGLLIPRMSTAQRNTISSPAEGLTVYDLTTSSFWVYNSSGTPGWKQLLTTNNIPANNTGFMAYLSSDQACPGFCPIQFNAVVFDDGGNFNAPFRRYFAPVTGLYHFDVHLTVSNQSGFYQVFIERFVGGISTTVSNSTVRPASIGFYVTYTISINIKLNAGESVGVTLSAGTATETIRGAQAETWFSGYKVN